MRLCIELDEWIATQRGHTNDQSQQTAARHTHLQCRQVSSLGQQEQASLRLSCPPQGIANGPGKCMVATHDVVVEGVGPAHVADGKEHLLEEQGLHGGQHATRA